MPESGVEFPFPIRPDNEGGDTGLPESPKNVQEILERTRTLTEQGLLISDVPPVIGKIPNPKEVLHSSGVFSGRMRFGEEGITITQQGRPIPLADIDEGTRIALPSARVVEADIRRFVGVPTSDPVEMLYIFRSGDYSLDPDKIAESNTSNNSFAHIDWQGPTLLYWGVIGPRTITFPGRFSGMPKLENFEPVTIVLEPRFRERANQVPIPEGKLVRGSHLIPHTRPSCPPKTTSKGFLGLGKERPLSVDRGMLAFEFKLPVK